VPHVRSLRIQDLVARHAQEIGTDMIRYHVLPFQYLQDLQPGILEQVRCLMFSARHFTAVRIQTLSMPTIQLVHHIRTQLRMFSPENTQNCIGMVSDVHDQCTELRTRVRLKLTTVFFGCVGCVSKSATRSPDHEMIPTFLTTWIS